MNGKPRFWLPSLADLFFSCAFLRLTLSSDTWLLSDADTGYHIRTGEYILHNFTIPKHDIFSYITPPLPWVAHEWLSEVIMALVHKFSGLTGIVIFFSFLIGLTYFVLFRFAQSLKGDFFVTALIVLLATASSSIHWLARPHIFSLFLTVIWYAILDRYQYQGKDRVYLLPFLMLLWINLHGAFVTGFVLLGIYLIGNIRDALFAAEAQSEMAKERCKKIAIITIMCLFASLFNPRKYAILLFPFEMVSNHFVMENVPEFRSPNFHVVLPFLYLFILTIGILAVARTSLNTMEFMLVLLFAYMSLYSARSIPIFAIIITPILVRRLQVILQKVNNHFANSLLHLSENLKLVDASARGHLWSIISVLGVSVLALNGKIAFKFDKTIKPVAAVEFLKKETIKGNMFNDDEFGDYLIYAAWPQYKVFFDGRSDMYGETWGRQYLKVANVQPGWEKAIDKSNIAWVFSSARSPLSTILLENKEWKLIYADNVAHIYLKSTPQNQPLMNRYSYVKPKNGARFE